MTRIALTGWRHGFRKVELTKELRALLGPGGLAAAKLMTDRLLAGEVIALEFQDVTEARSFLARVKALGVDGHELLP